MIPSRSQRDRSALAAVGLAVITLVLGASVGFPGLARAEPLTAGVPDCGGDAFSSAQVIENRPPRRGPLTAIPQTLCADLAPQRPPANVEIGIYPSIGRGHGGNGPRAPY